MAEFTQLRIEEFVPIFAEIKRLDLLRPKQLLKFNAEIQEHEHSIQKQTRCLDDILRYVEFQLNLLKTIERQRQALQVFEKKTEIDDKIKNRISSLFGLHERAYYEDLQFWMARIDFAKSQNSLSKAAEIYIQAARVAGSKYPFLWRDASFFDWEIKKLVNIDSARKTLQLGIRDYRQNIDLYLWAYELELKHAQYLLKKLDRMKDVGKSLPEIEDFENEVDKCKKAANVIFKQSKNNCWATGCTVRIYVKFHSIINKYCRFDDLEGQLLKDLEANCSSDEEAYKVLALLEFNKNKFECGCEALDRGLKVTGTIKMYDIAVNCLHLFAESNPSAKVFEKLQSVLISGQSKDKLSATCYETWIKLFDMSKAFHASQLELKKKEKRKRQKLNPKVEVEVNENESETEDSQNYFSPEDSKKVFESGLAKYPDNLRLVVLESIYNIQNESYKPSMIRHTFGILKKIDKLDMQWMEFMFLHAVEKFSKDSAIGLMKNLVKQCDIPKFAVFYLRYVDLSLGMDDTRIVFRETQLYLPYEAWKFMAHLESIHANREVNEVYGQKKVRDIMEAACLKFGKDRIDVWVDFNCFEKKFRNEKGAADIRARALKSLVGEARETFVQKIHNLERESGDRCPTS